jgi:hypothetical protein
MFRIVSERLCWWPVTFPGVTEEGGIIENKIELRFKVLDEDDFQPFVDRLTGISADQVEADVQAEKPTESARAAALLSEVVRDWRLVAAANGEALPFSAENFRALLRTPNVGGAIGRAYISCRNAKPEVREGN